MKSDWIRGKERRQQLDRVKRLRANAEKASQLQIDYLIALGLDRGWPIEPLLNRLVGDLVPTWARANVTEYAHLTKAEASTAIDRMKAGRYGRPD